MTDKKYEAYENAIRQVWMDGAISIDEADMIEALRKSLNITFEEHAEIEKKIRKELELSRSGDESGSSEISGSDIESPKPDVPSGPEAPQIDSGKNLDNSPEDEISDVSSRELSQDLEDLSKSIDKLGQKIGRKEQPEIQTGSVDSALSESPAGDNSANHSEDSSLKFGALSLKISHNSSDSNGSDSSQTDESSGYSAKNVTQAEPEPASAEDTEAEEKPSGSDLLEQLKMQYELDQLQEETVIPNISEPDESNKDAGDGAAMTPTAVSEDSDMDSRPLSTPQQEPVPKPTPVPTPLEEPDSDEDLLEDDDVDLLTPDEFLEAGKLSFRKKDYQKAMKHYQSALEIDPDNREVKFFLKKVVTAIKDSKSAPEQAKPEDSPKPKKKKKRKAKRLKSKTPEPESEDLAASTTDESVADIDATPVIEPEEPPAEISIKDDEAAPAELSGESGSCSSCGGTGSCNWCKGDMKCYWCSGSGKCTNCQGAKEIDGSKCPSCNGEGTCGSCAGAGNCTWCKGAGKCTVCNS